MLNKKLTELKKLLIDESLIIEKMLDFCFEGYIEKISDKITQVFAMEEMVNTLDNKIDDFCTSLIALHNPEAKSLRIVLVISKMNNDLERMGDLALNIAKSYLFLIQKPYYKPVIELAKLAKDTKSMLQSAMSAFIYEDTELAEEVRARDYFIDRQHDRIFKLLINNVKISVEIALNLNRISKNYERIADLSTNIAENTIYMCKGNNVKHDKKSLKIQNNEK
jgi:phosphate transport system protein